MLDSFPGLTLSHGLAMRLVWCVNGNKITFVTSFTLGEVDICIAAEWVWWSE